jgi:catechol 2,3-dioxygenase-like lactoylglutathione lyase family enzyme
MFGSFLEISMSVSSLAEELAFYRSLGFEELPTADFVSEPYAVVWDGTIVIGLHTNDKEELTLSFVRPDLEEHLPALKRLSIRPTRTELGEDRFNRICFEDPEGQTVQLLEARTYSPADWDSSNVAQCGTFLEVSLPVSSVGSTADFWSRLGLKPAEQGQAPHAWIRLRGDGIALGLHETHMFAGLSYETRDFRTRCEFLRARGLLLENGAPIADRGVRAVTIASPSGLAFYLKETIVKSD